MSKRAVVIGGGIIGFFVALYAQRAGFDTTLLERDNHPLDNCSLGNAGMIVPSHFIPLASPGMPSLGLRMLLRRSGPFSLQPHLDSEFLRWGRLFLGSCTQENVNRGAPVLRDLALDSRAEYSYLASETGNPFGLQQKGLMMLCRTERGLEEEAHLIPQAAKLRLQAEKIYSSGIARLNPGTDIRAAGAIYYPQDCFLDPKLLLQTVRDLFLREGGRIEWGVEALGFMRSSQRIEGIRTVSQTYTADEYILAGGSWSAQLLRSLKIALPLQPGKGYSIDLPATDNMPQTCAILVEDRVAVTPMGDRLRIGGTMSFEGFDFQVNRRRVQGFMRAFRRFFPAYISTEMTQSPVWSGLRPCSPDGLPYIGRMQAFPNLSLATGHAMMGVSLAPATGKLTVQALRGEEPTIDLLPLRPERFESHVR